MLTNSELDRYQRQIRIIGDEGQEKLKRTKVLIAGAGGLGSVISVYAAVAGIGTIRIVDCDVVELSNLNRQILHWDLDVGREKTESAQDKLQSINPDVEVETILMTIDGDNVYDLVGDSDLIIDAMDNFSVRYLLNESALRKNIPLFHGAISGFNGQATSIIPGKTACLRCIFPTNPPAETSPVIGTTCGIIGCIQATEAIKYILEIGELLENRLLLWDGLNAMAEEIPVERNPRCIDCGDAQNV